jgi:hypothetical protein
MPFFDSCKALSIIEPSEGISNKNKVNQNKMINKVFERAVGRACSRSASKLFNLIKNKIKITNAKLGTNKILTNNSERVLKGWLVEFFKRTIYTRLDPKAIRGVRITPCRDVFVCEKTLKFQT